MSSLFAEGIIVAISVAIGLFVFFGVIAFAWILGNTNTILTFVNEGQAKIVTTFGAFGKSLMSFSGREFRFQCDGMNLEQDKHYIEIPGLESDKDPWDVLKLTPKGKEEVQGATHQASPLLKNPLGGLRVVGIPLLHTIHEARFSWVSLEQKQDRDGTVVNVPVFSEKPAMDYILVQEDVYVSETGKVETADLLPVNIMLLITAAVINPRKAVFNVQHWLEATQNQIRPAVREYIGTKTFDNLVSDVKAGATELKSVLTDGLPSATEGGQESAHGGILHRILVEYGVEVRSVQIFGIDPTETFRELTMKRYEGEMEAARIRQFYKAVQEFGDHGRAVLALETLQKTGSNIVFTGKGSELVPTMQLLDTTIPRNGVGNDHLFFDVNGNPISPTQQR